MNFDAVWVIAAAIVNFALGGVWYAAFGKVWAKAWKISSSEGRAKDAIPYLIAFIGSLWASYGLFLICKHIQPKDLLEELTIAVGCWIFIVVGLGAKHYSFARVNGKAFAIDYGLDLVGLIIMTMMVW